jgi:CHASE3 domain sensor protein
MKLKNFSQHINEAYDPNDERYAKLRSLGLTDEPELEDRMQGLQQEWGDDYEIMRLTQALKKRTEDLIDKWFPTDDPADSTAEEHFQEYFDMLQELSTDELGMLEYLVVQKWAGY